MPDIERTLTVATPLPRVWEFMTDFTTTEEWDPPTVSTTRTSGDGGVGTTYHNVSKLLGKEQEVEYTVSQVDPQQLFQVEGVSGSVELRDTITFEPTDEGGTRLTYKAEFHPTGASKLAEPLLPPALKLLGDHVEKSLQATLEKL
jgi:uncharacterized protein YndB with AHSA1/START domain